MEDYERLGVFYLGKKVRPDGALGDELVLYDSRDLTTHALCVGMTGSGKTGLCLALLEEAAIDGIPAILIDPKGDLGNLLLTFPELRPSDFQPWIDPEAAARKGITPEALAEETAAQWRKGLEAWGQPAERIARLRAAADLAIYTPGSRAGIPLGVLRSFDAPPPAVASAPDLLHERVLAAVSGLLSLLGIEADPLRSREHVLVSTILESAWREGRGVELAGLIAAIQKPPFERVGVLDLESFYPAKERFELAMALNNLIASPGFAVWAEGEPLDVARLLRTPEGKPRLAIVSIAHLPDAQRMFLVTLLLNEIIAWMRSQPGTSSLRAIVYMDEIFGYFPPTANPPSKTPMLTLLKQARAFGVGVVLATQNPVDLDYKGLSNAGTWFIGRLQTERDKARLLDGLEGASAASGRAFDRAATERILSGLASRRFLMNNVHDDAPTLFETRWVMSYLRGPLTREQIATLMAGRSAAAPAAVAAAPPTAPKREAADRPVLAPGIQELFLAPSAAARGSIEYRPAVFASARLHYVSPRAGLDSWESAALMVPLADDAEVAWAEASALEAPALDKQPVAGAGFTALPAAAARAPSYEKWKKSFVAHLYQERALTVYRCAELKEVSRPGESEAAFRVRLGEAARAARDAGVAKLRAKYAPKLGALEDRIRRAEDRVAREGAQASQTTVDAAVSFGSTVLGAIFGRGRLTSASNLGRARGAARAASRVAKERGDIARAQEDAADARAKLAELETTLESEVARLAGTIDPMALALEPVRTAPRKGDISVGALALLWTPWTVGPDGLARPAF